MLSFRVILVSYTLSTKLLLVDILASDFIGVASWNDEYFSAQIST